MEMEYLIRLLGLILMMIDVLDDYFARDLILFIGPNRGTMWVLFMKRDGTVKNHTKISDTLGNFDGILDNNYFFGSSVSWVSDLDGDGIPNLAVRASGDGDGGTRFVK